MVNADGKSGGGGGGKAPPFNAAAQSNPQKTYQQTFAVEYGPASGTPAGGLLPFGDIAKNVNPVRGSEIGAGSIAPSDARPPFRLNGGGK
jgi:hypothetical protein